VPGGRTGVAATTLEVVRDLAELVVPRTPIRSIAVIGNAPLPPDPERARRIDAADCVIRVNGFRTDADGEPTVGSRTDVVVFTRGTRATPWLFQDYRRRLYLLVEPARMHWEGPAIPQWWPRDLGFVSVPNGEVSIPAAAELGIDLHHEPHWPTTGTIAIWIGTHLVPGADVMLCGFSFLADANQTYWEHATGLGTGIAPEHRLDKEAEAVLRWIDAGLARLI